MKKIEYKYKIGDKVEIKVKCNKPLCSEFLIDVQNLNNVLTIREQYNPGLRIERIMYRMEEFVGYRINWLIEESYLNIIKEYDPEKYNPEEHINSRFEILDL